MGDQHIDPAGDLPPLRHQLIARCIVGEPGQIGTPGSAVDPQSFDLHRAVFQKRSMGKTELPVLKEEVMIPSDADDMPCGNLSKPHVSVVEGSPVLPLKAAKIPAVNKQITLRND